MVKIDARREAERRRLPRTPVALQQFWKDYLLRARRAHRFQLLTATTAYRRFMHQQVEALDLKGGSRVLDLGSGPEISRCTSRRSTNPGMSRSTPWTSSRRRCNAPPPGSRPPFGPSRAGDPCAARFRRRPESRCVRAGRVRRGARLARDQLRRRSEAAARADPLALKPRAASCSRR